MVHQYVSECSVDSMYLYLNKSYLSFKTDPRISEIKVSPAADPGNSKVAISCQNRSFYNRTLICIEWAYVLFYQLSLQEAHRCRILKINKSSTVHKSEKDKPRGDNWHKSCNLYSSSLLWQAQKKDTSPIHNPELTHNHSTYLSFITVYHHHIIEIRKLLTKRGDSRRKLWLLTAVT